METLLLSSYLLVIMLVLCVLVSRSAPRIAVGDPLAGMSLARFTPDADVLQWREDLRVKIDRKGN